MSGFFRAVGTVAGAVATVAVFVPGLQPIAGIAAGVAAVSGTLAQVTAKGPTAQGSVQGYLVGANNPLPYLIGEAYTEGVELYRVGYGGEVNDVDNPYAFIPRVLSCCGPIESMGSTYVNYESTSFTGAVGTVQEASGYYNEYLYHDQQLGERPEADALASPSGWGTPTHWSSAHKLSGFAAVGWSLIWSKKGRRFAGGQIPPLGKVPQGVKVYDPRLDSTYPGGSGAQRITDESTWAYSNNPALHALTYAYGRIMNGKPIFGVRLFDASAINLAKAIAWANVCDANGWTVNGTIYEPGDKWNNLKRICEAGGAQPVPGSVLDFDYQAPRTALATVTLDDLAGPVSASLGRGWKNRKNALVARYRSGAHQWGYVQADRVEVAAWITEDGEEKIDERQWDLVTGVDQVTELATYDLYQRREAGPIIVPCKPHMRIYNPGDALTLAEDLGAHPDGAITVVIRRKATDPISGVVRFICELETAAKHTAALGLTGGAPASITWATQQDIDTATARNLGQNTQAISSSYTTGLAGLITQSHNGDGTVDVVIPNHTRVYSDGSSVAVTGTTLTLPETNDLLIYYDDEFRDGGAVTFSSVNITTGGSASDAYFSSANPYRHFIASVTTVNSSGTGGTTGGSSPPGGGGWSGVPGYVVP